MAYTITVAINKKENESYFLKIHCSLYLFLEISQSYTGKKDGCSLSLHVLVVQIIT